MNAVGLQMTDAVEKVGLWQKRTVAGILVERDLTPSGQQCLVGEADLGQLAEVLGCCGEVELVSSTVGTA